MNKLTHSKIVKALECCVDDECEECCFYEQTACREYLLHGTIDLINRQKAEIERLLQKLQHPVVAENAITGLREKCIEKQEFLIGEDNKYKGYVSIEDLDVIVDELQNLQ